MLLDVHMASMDGMEVTKAIRRKEKKTGARVPIIAITDGATKDDRIKYIKSGVDDYIQKPLDMSLLIKKIDALVQKP